MVECMSTLPGSLSTLRDLKRLIPLELEPEFDTWLKHVEATAALVSPFSKLEPPIDVRRCSCCTFLSLTCFGLG